MSPDESSGRAESIRHRLRNELRARGEDVALGIQRYAVERFLYRLGRSNHRERFILKGATLFAIWGTAYRPTRDVDFTGYGSPDPNDVKAAFREICNTPDDVDQLVFETDTMTVDPIRDDSEYDGLRLRIGVRLGDSTTQLQVDVGFGNDIVPGPEEAEYRTILGDPPPRVLAYPRESVVAEKTHAMVMLGERNSRYKDFYDLQAIASAFPFERTTLVRAVKATFERRATPAMAETPVALTGGFYASDSRAQQWRAYVSRNRLDGVSLDFRQVGEVVISLLLPVWEDLISGRAMAGHWRPGGPWR